jgi:hypothetical protein
LVSWVWRRSRGRTPSEHRRAWNEEDICCHCRGRNDCRFARRNARKRTAWRRPRRRGSGPLLARPLRSRSRAIRRFWQLRMGDAAFLERQWLAGPPSASLWLIRDDGEICTAHSNRRRRAETVETTGAAKREAKDDCSDERFIPANSMSRLWHLETCRRSAIMSDCGAAPEATGAALIAPRKQGIFS